MVERHWSVKPAHRNAVGSNPTHLTMLIEGEIPLVVSGYKPVHKPVSIYMVFVAQR